jgi:hypothetical protein
MDYRVSTSTLSFVISIICSAWAQRAPFWAIVLSFDFESQRNIPLLTPSNRLEISNPCRYAPGWWQAIEWVSNCQIFFKADSTSMVKQWPGSMTPGSSFTEVIKNEQALEKYRWFKCTLMVNPWGRMKHFADSMTHKWRWDRIILVRKKVVDGFPYIFEKSTWSACRDCLFECDIGYVDKFSALVVLNEEN